MLSRQPFIQISVSWVISYLKTSIKEKQLLQFFLNFIATWNYSKTLLLVD